MADVVIRATRNGSYHVKGTVVLQDSAGNQIPTEGEFWLCLCGHSQNKPFCDSSHSKMKFVSIVKKEEVKPG
ncbi:MAG: CDGSH iron-sulfur domain-containing protein [Chloroflexi bacterium]|nr:CDGSH iron-sulfur domain-containing protein [Chloroflexota bacterium]